MHDSAIFYTAILNLISVAVHSLGADSLNYLVE